MRDNLTEAHYSPPSVLRQVLAFAIPKDLFYLKSGVEYLHAAFEMYGVPVFGFRLCRGEHTTSGERMLAGDNLPF